MRLNLVCTIVKFISLTLFCALSTQRSIQKSDQNVS